MAVPRSSRLDGVLRRIIPSTSSLSYNHAFRLLGNSIGKAYSSLNPLTRGVPPNHLRVRVGVGNELLFSDARYLTASQSFWLGCLAAGHMGLDSRIVDVGVGCGRYAHVLRDLNFYGLRFSGTYVGIDIDEEQLAWCEANFDDQRFAFLASGHQSSSYRTGDTCSNGMSSLPDSSQDLVFSRSLFSHLLEEELTDYCTEAARVLVPGGKMLMTYYSLTNPPPTYGGRHTFRHKVGIARVESLRQPTAAVAYDNLDLERIALEAGFLSVRFTAEEGLWQQMLIAQR